MNNMKPILFSGPMVKAILEGRKTQTRRVMKMSRPNDRMYGYSNDPDVTRAYYDNEAIKCPYGKVGDILYVRETWVRACLSEDGEGPVEGEKWEYWYRADDEWTKHDWHNPNVDGPVAEPRWKPSIHMPREAARVFLKITDIRVERLQEISEEDAKAEGVLPNTCDDPAKCPSSRKGTGCCGDGEYFNYLSGIDGEPTYSAVESFETLWKSINGENSWNENPFVWVISFEKIDKPTNV